MSTCRVTKNYCLKPFFVETICIINPLTFASKCRIDRGFTNKPGSPDLHSLLQTHKKKPANNPIILKDIEFNYWLNPK